MKKFLLGLAVIAVVVTAAGAVMAADTASVTVSAAVVGTCKFNSGGSMDFGNLDPASGADVAATVTQPAFWCTKSAAYTLDDDNGQNESGTTHRVKHASSNDYIPYTFAYTGTGTGQGKNTAISMDIAGSITGSDYVDSPVGSYADTVVVTVNP